MLTLADFKIQNRILSLV